MNKRNENILPKWAQRRIADLRLEIERLSTVEQAHAVLFGREWFVIPGPPTNDFPKDMRKLWVLDAENPFPVCSIFHGDVLLIGRSRDRWGGTPAPYANGIGGGVQVRGHEPVNQCA